MAVELIAVYQEVPEGDVIADNRVMAEEDPAARQSFASPVVCRREASLAIETRGSGMRPREPEISVDIVRALTPERKLQVAQQLRRTAWNVAAAGVRQRNPTWSEDQVQEEVRAIFQHVRT